MRFWCAGVNGLEYCFSVFLSVSSSRNKERRKGSILFRRTFHHPFSYGAIAIFARPTFLEMTLSFPVGTVTSNFRVHARRTIKDLVYPVSESQWVCEMKIDSLDRSIDTCLSRDSSASFPRHFSRSVLTVSRVAIRKLQVEAAAIVTANRINLTPASPGKSPLLPKSRIFDLPTKLFDKESTEKIRGYRAENVI